MDDIDCIAVLRHETTNPWLTVEESLEKRDGAQAHPHRINRIPESIERLLPGSVTGEVLNDGSGLCERRLIHQYNHEHQRCGSNGN